VVVQGIGHLPIINHREKLSRFSVLNSLPLFSHSHFFSSFLSLPLSSPRSHYHTKKLCTTPETRFLLDISPTVAVESVYFTSNISFSLPQLACRFWLLRQSQSFFQTTASHTSS
jgi:hypothetical protein